MHKAFHGFGRDLIHHLQPGRNHARRDDVADRRARRLDRRERGHRDLRELRFRCELHGDLGDDAEQAFGADHQREQVVARRVERVAAELNNFAGHQHHAQLANVVHGETVLQTMHATGIFGDVAANRASNLRRRIGRVVQAVLRHHFADREIPHAGLHARGAGERIDVEHAHQFRGGQQEGVRAWHRATGQTGACPSRDHRYALRMAELHHRCQLRFVFGQDYAFGQRAVHGEAIAFVRAHVLLCNFQIFSR